MSAVEIDNFELPKNWMTLPIGELGKAITGNTPPTKNAENYGGEIPFIKPTELVDKGVFSGRETISEKGAKYARILPKGGVLVSCIGYLGKTAIAKREVAFNQQINAVVFNEAVLPEYGFYYFQSPRFRKDLESLASGTTISIVNKSKFESISIPLAPLEQQKRIVAKIEELFSHIDAGIAALKKAKQLLKQYRQSVLKAAVTGELTKEWREANKDKLEPASQLLERILETRRQLWEEQQLEQFKTKGRIPKDDKWKGKYPVPQLADEMVIPNEWVTASLDQLTEYITSESRGWAKFYADTGATFIRAQNLKCDYLNLDNIAFVNLPDKSEGMRTRVKYGDFLVTITGANVTKTGYVNIELDEAYVSQHVALCRPTLTKCMRYLYTFLISKDGARKKLEEAAYGAGKPGLNLDNLKTLQIALPNIEEQEEIVRLVEQQFASIQRLEDELFVQLKKAAKSKQSVLASAFQGKITNG